jgi:D-glycero-D-manno-heptose 1,7-bisphosphate phosphatase
VDATLQSPRLVIVEAGSRGHGSPGIADADEAASLARLNHVGVQVLLLVSESPVVGRPDVGEINRYHAAIHRAYAESGAHIDAILFCPHPPGERCGCRLPSPRLMSAACTRFCVERRHAVVFARSMPVRESALRAGLGVVLIGDDDRLDDDALPGRADTVNAAVERLLADVGGRASQS